jgi:cytoskeletal protein RodZ
MLGVVLAAVTILTGAIWFIYFRQVNVKQKTPTKTDKIESTRRSLDKKRSSQPKTPTEEFTFTQPKPNDNIKPLTFSFGNGFTTGEKAFIAPVQPIFNNASPQQTDVMESIRQVNVQVGAYYNKSLTI